MTPTATPTANLDCHSDANLDTNRNPDCHSDARLDANRNPGCHSDANLDTNRNTDCHSDANLNASRNPDSIANALRNALRNRQTPTPTPAPQPTAPPTPKSACTPRSAQQITWEQQDALYSALYSSQRWFPQELVELLESIAMHTPEAFDALMPRLGPLSQAYGGGYLYKILLPSYQAIALCDEATATKILGMPFLSDSYYDAQRQKDRGVISRFGGVLWDSLSRLAESDLDGLQRVLSHSELEGGITNERVALTVLLALEQEDPEAAAAIRALPWVQDGIENRPNGDYHEDEGLRVVDLVGLAWRSKESLRTLLSRSWAQEDYGQEWFLAVQAVFYLAAEHDSAGALVLELFDQPDEPLYHVSELLSGVGRHPEKLVRVLSSPELLGAAASEQRKAVLVLLILREVDPDAASTLEALPFIQDGISPHEQDAVYWLWRVALGPDDVLPALVARSWVQDGLEGNELSAVRILANMMDSYSSTRELMAVQRIIGMPFLEELDSLDVAVLQSLQNLQGPWPLPEMVHRDRLWHVVTHPSLGGGITDARRSVIAISDVVAEARPELLDTLLNPEQTIVKERSIVLPLTGEVALSVIRPEAPASHAAMLDEGASHTIDLMEHAVRHHEEFMGVPYPRKYVAALAIDLDEDIARGGTSELVLAVGVSPDFHDATDDIAHQTAHAYWPTSPDWRVFPGWISEGASTFLASKSENARVGVPLPEITESCSTFSSIHDMGEAKHDWWDYSNSNTTFLFCDSALGEGMFVGLYGDLGDEAFRQGFTALSLSVQDVLEDGRALDDENPCTTQLWMFRDRCYLEEAFVGGDTTEGTYTFRAIFDRLYGWPPR